MNELDLPVPGAPVTDNPAQTDTGVDVSPSEPVPAVTSEGARVEPAPPVDPVRAAAGRLGGQRVHKLVELGREYEKEHGLKPGRQRRKQLIQLGRKYEVEHGLRVAKPRRKKKADVWQEFLVALARVVKPAYRPAVEQLVAALRAVPPAALAPTGEKAA